MFTEGCEVLTVGRSRGRCAAVARSAWTAVSARARSASPRATASTIAPCSAHDFTGRAGCLHHVHPRHLVPHLREQGDQPGTPGGLRERLVEPAAQGPQILALAPPGPLLAQPDQPAQHLEVGLGAPPGRPGGRQGLQQHPHLQEVGGLLLGRLGHTGARVAPRGHEPLGLQGPQRLADRDARDSVPAGQHFLGQPAARFEDPGDDVVADCRAYRVRRNTQDRTSAISDCHAHWTRMCATRLYCNTR